MTNVDLCTYETTANDRSAEQRPLTMSIRQAAKQAGVGALQMAACVKSGEFPSVVIGARTRVLTVPFMRKLRGDG